ncbi:pyruvate kinase [Oscillospiraceae bacterium]|uniref:pyruvate kinase n=1 Tax=Allofournierella sp. TaxID=1940256 RepID=UPI0015AAC225|nr:pyruvate kinase [Oscillospiraceae bacterium]
MRKTKIVCTLGPSTDREEVLRDMILSGMNVARFNFSHGNYDEHRRRLDALKKIRTELGVPVAALLDTKGPEIRLKQFAGGKAHLKTGQTFTLTTREVEGSAEVCSITYKDLPGDLAVGSTVLLADGLISMTVTSLSDTDIQCRVDNGGPISNNKGVNVPGVRLSMPYMSQRDKDDILFGIEQGFDFVAASFTRSAQDIQEIRRLLNAGDSKMRIIAKIENREGVDNIDEILAAADAVMIARGDMGVEIDFTEIPMIQKNIIFHSFSSGKPVITATQMLESMMENPRPTRAEITDVANAIYDGTSAIMLSGETAAGKYPVEAVRTMAAIAERTENDSSYFGHLRKAPADTRMSIAAATAHAAATTAADIKADAVVTVSKSGETARLLSKVRPATPIIACVMEEAVQRHLALSWGVTPLMMPYAHDTDELIDLSVKAAEEAGLVQSGDLVVVTAGVPVGVSGTTNMIKVHLVGDSLLTGVGVGGQNAKGRVCVCRNNDEVNTKFQRGDVLVVPYTNNRMLDAMKEASAIIVEESGLNSHAAIVGLALGKAVIVGAAGATRIMKDGTMVSVDCERGIVQSMAQ